MSRGALTDGLRMSVGTLTALRVPAPSRIDLQVARVAMLAAPLPGVALGAIAAGVAALGDLLSVPPVATAVGVVGSVALASRGLHLDGLADTADGLASSHERDRALAVMRTGDVGPAGAVTLVLVLVAQVGAVAALLGDGPTARGAVAAGLAVLAGRAVLPMVCAGPWASARPDGLGAAVTRSVPWPAALVVTAVVLAASSALAGLAGLPGLGTTAALVLGWSVAMLLVTLVARRIGGTTGDVLGAAVETATVVSLVALSAAVA